MAPPWTVEVRWWKVWVALAATGLVDGLSGWVVYLFAQPPMCSDIGCIISGGLAALGSVPVLFVCFALIWVAAGLRYPWSIAGVGLLLTILALAVMTLVGYIARLRQLPLPDELLVMGLLGLGGQLLSMLWFSGRLDWSSRRSRP